MWKRMFLPVPSPTAGIQMCISHFCNRKHGCLYSDSHVYALMHCFLSFFVHPDRWEDRCWAHHRVSNSVGLGWGPQISISKSQADLDAPVPGTTFWETLKLILGNSVIQASSYTEDVFICSFLCEVGRVSRARDQTPNPIPLTCPIPSHQVLVFWTEGNGSRNNRGAHLLPPISPSTNINTTQVVLLLQEQEIHSYCN